jgi:hypothetical protein
MRSSCSRRGSACARRGPFAIDEPWSNVEAALIKPPKFVSEDDLVILRSLWLGHSRRESRALRFARFANGGDVLHKLDRNGSAVSGLGRGPVPLKARLGRYRWARRGRAGSNGKPQADDRLRPVLRTEPRAAMVLPTEPVWYVDGDANEAGIVESSLPFQQLPDYLAMPPISLAEAPLVAAVLREVAPDLPLPPTHDTSKRFA